MARYSSNPNRSRPLNIDPGPPNKETEKRAPATWAGVKKLPDHAHSDLILNFRVPEGNDLGLPVGDFVAFLSFNADWAKYSGMIKRDERKRDTTKEVTEWAKKSEAIDDIPF